MLLRQRRQARPDRTRTSCTCWAPTATTSAHRRAASSARPTAAPPGRTSATTCTPTSTPSPSRPTTPSTSPSATTAASGSRTPAAAATAPTDPLSAARLAEPQRAGRPEHRGPDPLHRPGDRPVHLDGHRAPRPRASTGAAPRTTAPCASRLANSRWFDQSSGDGGQVIVDQTTPNDAQPDGAGVRVRHLLRHLAVPLRPLGDQHVLRQRGDRRRHRPEGPGRVLRAVGAEPRRTSTRCSSAPTGSTAPTTRRPPSAGDVTWEPDQPRPHERLHRRRPQRRARLPDLARSASPTAVTASTSAPTRAGSRSAPTPSRPTRRPGTASAAAAAQPAGQPDRGRPVQLADRLRGVRRLRCRHPGPTRGHVFATSDGGRHWQNITANLPDVPGQLRRARPGRREDALRRHRRRRRSSPPTAAGTWFALGSGDAEGERVAARLRRHPRRARRRHPRTRRLHADQHRGTAGAGRVQGRRRQRRSVRAARSTTRSRCGTSATPTPRASR